MSGETQMKVLTLMNYIRQMCAWRQSPVTNVQQQDWMLDLDGPVFDEKNSHVSLEKERGVLLEISCPKSATCPPLPESLEGWISTPQWEDLRVEEVETYSKLSQNRQAIVRFHDSDRRVRDFAEWRSRRDAWRADEDRKAQTRQLFDEVYCAYDRFRRNEKELEFVIGNGFFSGGENGEIHHPLLLKRVQVRYGDNGCLQVIDTGEEVELYGDLLLSRKDLDNIAVRKLQSRLSGEDVPLLQKGTVEKLLREMAGELAPKCRYGERDGQPIPPSHYVLSEHPVLLLRKKSLAMDRMAAAIMMRIGKAQDIPVPLLEFVEEELRGKKEDVLRLPDVLGEPEDILLAAPANAEQIGVVRQTGDSSVTVAHCPPGTGKRRMLSILLGHFLAKGSRVLVTGPLQASLQGIKKDLPEGMRDLCAEVLETPAGDMCACVDGICGMLQSSAAEELGQAAQELEQKRKEAQEEIRALRGKLAHALEQEGSKDFFSYEGEPWSLSQMAQFVHDHEDLLEIVPGRIRDGIPLPLDKEELSVLYGSNGFFQRQDLKEMEEDLPDSQKILAPENLGRLFRERALLNGKERGLLQELPEWSVVDGQVFFRHEPLVVDFHADEFLEAEENYRQIDFLWLDSIWAREAVLAGRQGDGARLAWEQMGKDIQRVQELKNEAALPLLGRLVECPEEILEDERIPKVLSAMQAAFDGEGNIPLFRRLLHRRWRTLSRRILVDGHRLRSREDCQIALSYLLLQQARQRVRQEWNQLLGQCGEPAYDELQKSADDVDDICSARWEQIAFCLDWYEKRVTAFQEHAKKAGIDVERLLPEGTRFMTPRQRLAMDFQWLQNDWPQCAALLRLVCIEKQALLRNYRQRIAELSECRSQLAKRMAAALQGKNDAAYAKEYDKLLWYESLMDKFHERKRLLAKLEETAPDWAEAISRQQGISGLKEVPASLGDAWKCRQFLQQLEKLLQEDMGEWENELRLQSARLRELSADLAGKLAWKHCLEEMAGTKVQERLAQQNEAWKLGDAAPRHLRVERERMMEAIPAWIMPLDKVWETLRPASRKFDLIIMEDTGQLDLTSLLLFYFGHKILLMGDEGQCGFCPLLMPQEELSRLQGSTLQGKFRHPELYAPEASLYGLARTYFGASTLKEHFSSLPEIISYASRLSYENLLQPLRESGASVLKPVISFELEPDRQTGNGVSQREADEISVLLAACMEQPEYKGKTFGAISLSGSAQGDAVRKAALRHIGTAALEERDFLCGVPEDFLGTSRDVVFLSLPESGEDPLRPMDDAARKAYSTATSRARDQLWILHSLELSSLRSGDIRRGLLEYAVAPGDFLQFSGDEGKTGSGREVRHVVADALRKRGYRIEEEWPAGSCRVDVAVLSGEKRAAIVLCDGEESGELAVKRQAVLERMGWSFLHLRGSEFCRSPEKAAKRLEEELRSREILPMEPGEAIRPLEEARKELMERILASAAQIREAWKL